MDPLVEEGIPKQDGAKNYWSNIMRFVDPALDWAEFGVATGASARMLYGFLPKGREFFLFDTFTGLPKDWVRAKEPIVDGVNAVMTPRGTFDCEGKAPAFADPRVKVVKGLFEDTIPEWEYDKQLGFIHVDCDLASSARTVLFGLGERIRKGTVIAFDEFFDGPNTHGCEVDAFRDYVKEKKVKFGYIGGIGTNMVSVVIL